MINIAPQRWAAPHLEGIFDPLDDEVHIHLIGQHLGIHHLPPGGENEKGSSELNIPCPPPFPPLQQCLIVSKSLSEGILRYTEGTTDDPQHGIRTFHLHLEWNTDTTHSTPSTSK